jgi:uncharacterized protein
MIEVIGRNRKRIAALCEKHGVVRLDVFGSAANGAFRDESDLDFIVDLGAYDAHVGDRFLDFADDLERMFARHVDLVTERSITNPYFRQSVNASRENIYAAGDGKAAA